MSPYWIVVSLALTKAAAFVVPGVVTKSTENPCYESDSYADEQIRDLRITVAGTDSVTIQWRRNVHLPAVPSTAVALVSDSVICARALTAFNRATRYDDGPATRLYLFSVGNVYVGTNPHFRSGEWVQHIVMDSTFAFLGAYLK